jgi:hypothetical protein
MPGLIVVRTGVPRAGGEEELPMVDVPRIPLATSEQLAALPPKGTEEK